MATTYTTRQGETVDLVCWRHYGRTREVTESVLAANPGVAALGPVLPFATRLVLPVIAARAAALKLVSLWD
jgi:phage tail protein X